MGSANHTRVPGSIYTELDLAELYDAGASQRRDFRYCRTLADGKESVLDLGCGTGAFAVALYDVPRVVGVDPASGMLSVAKTRAGGDRVAWVQADAGSVRLDERFDLIVLTGHTFQVFLDEDQQLSVLRTITAHLNVGGIFIFDTRNPGYPGRKERTKDETRHVLDTPDHGLVEKWNVSTFDENTSILGYSNGYRILATGEVRTGEDRIRYTAQADVADLLDRAGLRVNQWLGDWDGSPFSSLSREIIPVGTLA